MASDGPAPEWPDKAMFAAILLVLAGAVGTLFRLALPLITVQQDNLPRFPTQDWPGYELGLCVATMVAGALSLWRQAAVYAYAGAVFAVASLAVFGLVPALGVLAVAAMVKSHLEGEETRNDGIQLHSAHWPDKAMAASLFMVVVATIAVTQGLLILAGRFDPILLSSRPLAGSIGVAVGLLGLAAAREVYHVRRPWLGWAALALGMATLGFYLIGPVLALVGMVLLGLAHREMEFDLHAPEAAAAPPPKGRRRRPADA